jgi:acetate kinase
MTKQVLIDVSARHIHLSEKDRDALFGKGYKLKKAKELRQKGDFLAKEKIDIENGLRKISKIAVIGPARDKTQIELSHTDIIFLKLKPIVRESGDIKATPGITLIGPKGKVKIKQGVINTWRHIHASYKEAKKLGLKEGGLVSVKIKGKCSLTFHNVIIRLDNNYRLVMHLDTDEGNAAGIVKKGKGEIICS